MVSREYRIYFGKKFSKNSDGYWACMDNKIPQAHRWVWINHHGEIPEGMIIHHIDHDPDNNEISNLEIMTVSDHILRHWKEGSYDLEQRREQLKEARKWHNTEEGKKKQSKDAQESWKIRKKVLKKCLDCDEEFETTQPWAKFCSDACDKRWRRKERLYNIEAKCELCDKLFLKDKFSPKRFCSISCGAKNSARVRNRK